MQVIPVIDLKRGQVVHARGGRRDGYRPIETPLAAGSAPAAVVAGLLRLFPFRSLYVADLDAIEGDGGHDAELAALAAAFPGLALWVDNGIAEAGAAVRWLDRGLGSLVLGSESQRDAGALARLSGDPRVVLSLDYRDAFLGPAAIRDNPEWWPARVVVMTLARVGAEAGPDLARVGETVSRADGRAVYAAGGVRTAEDLRALAVAGAAGVLAATALHAGRITAADLDAIARKLPPGDRS